MDYLDLQQMFAVLPDKDLTLDGTLLEEYEQEK